MSLIALLTDFGTRDPYVAAMKGVILSRCEATIVDLSHEIPPFDSFEAGMFLKAVLPYFPRGDMKRRMILMCVVDPGVGSARKILVAQRESQYLLAPDNGILPLALESDVPVHSVENEQWFLPAGSATFHGRDRFAPVAAALARGANLHQLGSPLPFRELVKSAYRPPDYSGLRGTVVTVDRFGNAITDIEAGRLGSPPEGFRLRVGSGVVETYCEYYSAAPPGQPFVIVGSRGTLEISIAGGSAADFLQLARFDSVQLEQK